MRIKRHKRGFTLIELMVTVAVIGVLAATAIPAFIRYVNKSKTAEARGHVRKIYDGARQYYLQSSSMPKIPFNTVATADIMEMADPQYPGVIDGGEFGILSGTWGVGVADPTCCARGGPNQKCQPDASLWDTAIWKALHFSVDDPAYYAYEYRPDSGALDYPQNFQARAYGNLDCDTTYSQFWMYGFADPTYADGPIGTGLMRRINELE
jgi:type IV pilus assembly protein PilA